MAVTYAANGSSSASAHSGKPPARSQLSDPSLGHGQLNGLVGAEPVDLAAIDALLLEPHVDRGFADPERLRELSDPCSSSGELDYLSTQLRRVSMRQIESSEYRTTL